MKDVGTFDKRNSEFDEKFSRDKIIKDSVGMEYPMIFDIGGHKGQSIDYFLDLFPNAKIYSFEPDPDSFEILSGKQSNNVKVFNIAVSDKIGSATFFRNNISHTNSLHKININSSDSIRATEERKIEQSKYSDEINSEITVVTTTLNDFTNKHSLQSIDLLKIDVQGAEESVLSGGEDVFDMVKSIIVEISLYDFYEKSSSFLGIESILMPAGFKLFSILDISRNPMNGRTDWVEVLYRKK